MIITVLSIKSVGKWEINIIFQMLIGNLLAILMRLTSVVLTSWISSITGKISWIFGWPWSNHVYVSVCVSVRLWLSVIDSTNWYRGCKNRYWYYLSGKFGFWPGEVMEKSWNFFPRFLWEPRPLDKGPDIQTFGSVFVVSPVKSLNKQSRGQWNETRKHFVSVTIMYIVIYI